MNNLLPFHGLSADGIHLFHPQSFEEAQKAIVIMKAGELLLVNLASLESKLAQRLADYLAGSALALSGKHTEIGKDIHLFAPPTFSITTVKGLAG